MEEKKYLKWYNKVGYGSGDMAGNVVYSFLSSFIMIYLTNIVGLNAGIVGTLIAVSKLFDGVTDGIIVSVDNINDKKANFVKKGSQCTFEYQIYCFLIMWL